MFRLGVITVVLACSASVAAQRGAEPASMVARVGQYVEEYFLRAQSLIAEETVILQPLSRDFGFDGFARRLVYHLRLDWNPSAVAGEPPATIVRELVSATGPPLGPPDQPDCLDPRTVSPEPLMFLLPDRREKFTFRARGAGRVDGRNAVTLEYTPRAPEAPVVKWTDACALIDLPGRTRGRIWADPATAEILRFDEHLVGPVDIPGPRDRRRPRGPDWFTVERADTSILYRRVTFRDPDETVMLPAKVDALLIVRNSGVPRLRMTQSFSNYRRFVTDARIVR
jgi:hypothetical protein